MDSTISLYHTLNRAVEGDLIGHDVHAMCIYYGQRHENELEASKRIWTRAFADSDYAYVRGHFLRVSLPPHCLIQPRVGSLMNTDVNIEEHQLGEPQQEGLDSSFIPHRNLLFITIAAGWCRTLAADEVVTGIRGGYPDCTPEFERALEQVLAISDPQHPIKVTSPVHRSRAESLLLARQIRGCMEAIGWSMTCFKGQEPPCGVCLPCTKRAEGFEQLGIADPLLVRLKG